MHPLHLGQERLVLSAIFFYWGVWIELWGHDMLGLGLWTSQGCRCEIFLGGGTLFTYYSCCTNNHLQYNFHFFSFTHNLLALHTFVEHPNIISSHLWHILSFPCFGFLLHLFFVCFWEACLNLLCHWWSCSILHLSTTSVITHLDSIEMW